MTLAKLLIGLVVIFLFIMLAHEIGPAAYLLGLVALYLLGTSRV